MQRFADIKARKMISMDNSRVSRNSPGHTEIEVAPPQTPEPQRLQGRAPAGGGLFLSALRINPSATLGGPKTRPGRQAAAINKKIDVKVAKLCRPGKLQLTFVKSPRQWFHFRDQFDVGPRQLPAFNRTYGDVLAGNLAPLRNNLERRVGINLRKERNTVGRKITGFGADVLAELPHLNSYAYSGTAAMVAKMLVENDSERAIAALARHPIVSGALIQIFQRYNVQLTPGALATISMFAAQQSPLNQQLLFKVCSALVASTMRRTHDHGTHHAHTLQILKAFANASQNAGNRSDYDGILAAIVEDAESEYSGFLSRLALRTTRRKETASTLLCSPLGAVPFAGAWFAQAATALVLHASRNSLAKEDPEVTAASVQNTQLWNYVRNRDEVRADNIMRHRNAARGLIMAFETNFDAQRRHLGL